MDAPSGEAPEQAPRWDLVDTEGCGGGIRFLAPVLIIWGYVGIYRRKEYISGALRGPRGRGARPWGGGGGALHPRDLLGSFLEQGPSFLDHIRLENHDPEGFIPFGLRLIFCFFEILKKAKNSNSGLGLQLIG